MKPFIYLCGKVDGLADWAAEDWRETVRSLLHPEFEVLSPLRGLGSRAKKHGVYGDPKDVGLTDSFIVERDLSDIRRSRAVLRYLSASNIPSFGSDMETAYAKMYGVPLVLTGPGAVDTDRLGPWMRYHSVAAFPFMSDATQFIKASYLLPGEEKEDFTGASSPATTE